MIKRTIALITLLLFVFTSSVQALSWAYNFVVYRGNVYEVKDEMVPKSDIGKNIGKVKTKPNDMTGNYYGDASNAYPKGTKYYKISNLPTDKAIAVEVGENQFQKAVYAHKAPFHWMDIFTKVLPVLVLFGLFLSLIIKIVSSSKKKKPQ